jgi:hypothetical protein
MTSPAVAHGRLHRSAKTAIIILGGLFVLAIVGVIALMFLSDLDSYELREVVDNPTKKSHALIYDYRHADSYERGIVVALTDRSSPPIGSFESPGDETALTWFGPRDALTIFWDADGRLIARIKGPHRVEYADGPNGCGLALLRSDDRSTICLHTSRVSIVED